MNLINLADFEQQAKAILPTLIYDYYAGGAGEELTLCNNQRAFNEIQFQYRVLQGLQPLNLATTLLNQPLSMPVVCAPMGFQSMAHAEGEIATVKAAHQQGIFAITSTMSNSSLEEAAQAVPNPLWFQLYIYKNRAITEALVNRAQQANYAALVLTVDAPVMGLRERDMRNHFTLPNDLTIKNLATAGLQHLGAEPGALIEYVSRQFDPSLSWEDVKWLRSITKLPIFVKGIVHADDAKIALDYGVDGIIVSNHGGRQLDTSIATIKALPAIAKVVKNRVPVLIDGGVRRGIDILKALALGADAVLLGRPLLWGLAVDGQQGVEKVLAILAKELTAAMCLLGFSTVEEVKKSGKHTLVI